MIIITFDDKISTCVQFREKIFRFTFEFPSKYTLSKQNIKCIIYLSILFVDVKRKQ